MLLKILALRGDLGIGLGGVIAMCVIIGLIITFFSQLENFITRNKKEGTIEHKKAKDKAENISVFLYIGGAVIGLTLLLSWGNKEMIPKAFCISLLIIVAPGFLLYIFGKIRK